MACIFFTVLINAINWSRADMNLHHLKEVFIFDKYYFWEEAALLRGHLQYYIPGWTLVIEMALSFFIPFGIILAKKDKKIILWLLLSYILIGNNLRDLYVFHIHFTLGILISCIYNEVISVSFKETKWFKYRYSIFIAALILFTLRQIDNIIPFGENYHYIAKYIGIDFFIYSAIASFVFIIVLIRSKKVKNILENNILLFFGKISYGIYLMHWLLVTDIFIYWDDLTKLFPNKDLAYLVIFTTYILVSILLATFVHYAIELPFIKLGKRIISKLKPSYIIN